MHIQECVLSYLLPHINAAERKTRLCRGLTNNIACFSVTFPFVNDFILKLDLF